MANIRMIEEFQKFFARLLAPKSSQTPREVISSLQKNTGYRNTGGVLRISYVDHDGQEIVLSDGSRWAAAPQLGLDQSHARYWFSSERVRVLARGGGSGNIHTLVNLNSGEKSRWIFQGYRESREAL